MARSVLLILACLQAQGAKISQAVQPRVVSMKEDVQKEVIYSNTQYLETKYYGIWDRTNACLNGVTCPWARGWAKGLTWRELEPQQGVFNFSLLDSALAKAYDANASFYTMVAIGPDSPAWIYSQGVPQVEVTSEDDGHGLGSVYPYYLHPKYIELRNQMIYVWAKYLREHPHSRAVGFIQGNYGCTGDSVLYKSDPINTSYSITASQETQHQYDIWAVYASAFQGDPIAGVPTRGKIIPVLANVDNLDDAESIAKLTETFKKGVGIKGSAYSRSHHLTGERSWITKHRAKLLNSTESSHVPFFFARAEMDQTWKKALAKINFKLAWHWSVINGLNQGLSVHDVSADAALDSVSKGFKESFDFFNKYAPQLWPKNATNAFIALHEGLDAEDLLKFPAGDKFGPAGNKNEERITKICQEYGAFGCRNDDKMAALQGQVYQRDKQTGFNDVGYDIWPTNYGRWIEQIDADITSQGLFRIGGGTITATTPKYARFARGLIHSAGKSGMYFKFSDGFFHEVPPGMINMNMIWYDNAAGSFQVWYKKGNAMVTALNRTCLGDKTWKLNEIFQLDSLIPGGSERGSDFFITSSSSTDVIFHLIEAARDILY